MVGHQHCGQHVAVAAVEHVEEDGLLAVGAVLHPHLVDDQQAQAREGVEHVGFAEVRITAPGVAHGANEVHAGGVAHAACQHVLQDGGGEVALSGAGLAGEDEAGALGGVLVEALGELPCDGERLAMCIAVGGEVVERAAEEALGDARGLEQIATAVYGLVALLGRQHERALALRASRPHHAEQPLADVGPVLRASAGVPRHGARVAGQPAHVVTRGIHQKSLLVGSPWW